MVTTQKIRINNLAKDLNMKSKDLLDALTESGIAGKTSTGTLDTTEFSVLFDRLTSDNQIKNMGDYLSGKADIERPKEPVTEEKPAAPEKPEAQPKEEHKIEAQQKKTETPAQPSKPAFRSQNQQKNQYGGQQKPQQNQPKVNFPQQAERGASRAADRFARPAQQQNQSKKPEVKENRPVQSQIPQPKKQKCAEAAKALKQ